MAETGSTDLKKVNTDWSELERKIHEHRRKRFLRILTVIIICAALFVGWIIFRMVMQYHEYQVISTQERADTEGTSFAELHGLVVRYNNEGVSCSDIEGKTLWSQPYEMSEPMMSQKDSYMAFADRLGKTVYIVNENGLAGQIATDYGIRDVDVAENGAAAVLMQEGDTAYLGLYALNGNKIAEGAIHFGGAGYPLDLALSPDGERIAVSILDVSGGKGNSTVRFYNFSAAGKEKTDNMMAEYTYEDTVIPKLAYLTDRRVAAFGTNGMLLFDGGDVPAERSVQAVTGEIRSVFCNESHIGLVVMPEQEESATVVQIYDINGTLVQSIHSDTNFGSARFLANGELCLLNGSLCKIYTMRGLELFSGDTGTDLFAVYSTGRYRRYLFIGEQAANLVRFRIFPEKTS